ncbi:hypothetical protein ARMGADRAFT_359336 [Armillaria gallica]|uniref:Uncharacterized protein n=1 Tax=Armillaria gallica TaxID=47427 RepID=A0A2H3DJR5_ARMGA|nr:hypothetical protein ARMGADRAFT_359336 [Armillaria gallica]
MTHDIHESLTALIAVRVSRWRLRRHESRIVRCKEISRRMLPITVQRNQGHCRLPMVVRLHTIKTQVTVIDQNIPNDGRISGTRSCF